MVFDLTNETGFILGARLSTVTRMSKQRIVPLFLRAKRFHILSRKGYEAKDVSITTCAFSNPIYRIAASSIEIQRVGPSVHITSRNNSLWVGPVPIAYWPYLHARSGDTSYIKKFRAGRSNRFGSYIYSTFGHDIAQWGEWRAHLDHRSKRGTGGGLDLKYDDTDALGGSYLGKLRSYYIQDQGEDRNDISPPGNDRFWAQWQHRHHLPYQIILDLELSKYSDRNFLNEYFEREFREQKDQETLAHLRLPNDNHFFWALSKFHVNSFQTETEYKPQIGYSLIAEPVVDRHKYLEKLLYSTETQIANLDRRVDHRESDTTPGQGTPRILRIDSHHRLESPFQIGFFKFTPFSEGRFSFYEHTMDEGNQHDRWIGSGGAHLSTTFWRAYDIDIPILKAHRLLHIVTPEIGYTNTYAASLSPNNLHPYDSLDTFTRFQEFRIKVVNRIKTRRHKTQSPTPPSEETEEAKRINKLFESPDPGQPIELLYLSIELPYFPDPGDLDKDNPWGILEYDLRLRPHPIVNLQGRLQHNFETDSVRKASIGINLYQNSWTTHMSLRHLHKHSLVGIWQVSFSIAPKWSFILSSQYDFHGNSDLVSRVTVRRIFQGALALDFNIEHDEGDDETSFTVSFNPATIGSRVSESVAREHRLRYNALDPTFENK
jgi:hypothetical protein